MIPDVALLLVTRCYSKRSRGTLHYAAVSMLGSTGPHPVGNPLPLVQEAK